MPVCCALLAFGGGEGGIGFVSMGEKKGDPFAIFFSFSDGDGRTGYTMILLLLHSPVDWQLQIAV